LTMRPLFYATDEFHVPIIKCQRPAKGVTAAVVSVSPGVADSSGISVSDRPAMEAITEVISAFECICPDDGCIYLSGEITTGKRFYDLLRRYGVHSRDELKAMLGSEFNRVWQDLMKENLAEGHAFFDRMHGQGHKDLVNPGPFFAKGWEQEHYLYLWEWVIVHKCREARFNSGWNFSNGCTLEYAISLRKGIPRLHADGNLLEPSEAILEIERTVHLLDSEGFDTEKLRLNLQRIKEAHRVK
jgi:hypothetical protein